MRAATPRMVATLLDWTTCCDKGSDIAFNEGQGWLLPRVLADHRAVLKLTLHVHLENIQRVQKERRCDPSRYSSDEMADIHHGLLEDEGWTQVG